MASENKTTNQVDGNIISDFVMKTLDANKYATKKTIAQGLLDVALLTANASQLKYVLQVGEKHEFYALMLTLISVSIVLQVSVGLLCLTLYLMRDCRLHLTDYHSSANLLNHVTTIFAFFITVLNLVISCFDPTIAKYAVVQAILCLLLGSSLNLNKQDDHKSADRANNVVLCINIILMAVNVLINSFEMKENENLKGT